jgi:hypothetical protein
LTKVGCLRDYVTSGRLPGPAKSHLGVLLVRKACLCSHFQVPQSTQISQSWIHDDTSMGRRSQPSTWPHDLHILSTTLNFSSRPSRGSSRSPTSSKKPSRIRLLNGNHVSAYCRSDDTERSNKPAVKCGIVPDVLPLTSLVS